MRLSVRHGRRLVGDMFNITLLEATVRKIRVRAADTDCHFSVPSPA